MKDGITGGRGCKWLAQKLPRNSQRTARKSEIAKNMASAAGSWIGKLGKAGGEDSEKSAATGSITAIVGMQGGGSTEFQKEDADWAQEIVTQGLRTAISKLRHDSPGGAEGA